MFFTAILAFFGKLPSWVWILVGLLIGAFLLYHRGEVVGRAEIQTKWDVAAKATLLLGEEARAEAELKIPGVAGNPDVAIGGKSCVVHDKWDRDCKSKPVRAVKVHHVLGH